MPRSADELAVLEFRLRAEWARELPKDWGQDWMSKPAQGMVRIALFAGFNKAELVKRLLAMKHTVQERHVLAVMDSMSKEHDNG
jgi:hypothetical protein